MPDEERAAGYVEVEEPTDEAQADWYPKPNPYPNPGLTGTTARAACDQLTLTTPAAAPRPVPRISALHQCLTAVPYTSASQQCLTAVPHSSASQQSLTPVPYTSASCSLLFGAAFAAV